jgi:DNA-binding HxlR family transcriptional regulator
VPPRVEYTLTEKGRALIPIIECMRTYGRQWLGAPDCTVEAVTRRAAVAALA